MFRKFKVRERLANLSQMANASLVIGLETVEIDPRQVRTYNSAVLVGSDGVLSGRYDKLHRVTFGEYIPLGRDLPLAAEADAVRRAFWHQRGTKAAVFDVEGFRFAPIICFEDTVPQLVRNVINATTAETPAGPKPVDFLVNLTNDGWFHGSSELDQHLITAAFRCVEFRTPMVRAVNTGISAFIDGDGVIRRKALGLSTGEPKQEEAVLVDTVPLDDRQSLYLAAGDWFGGACLACCGFVSLTGLFGRWLPGRKPVRS